MGSESSKQKDDFVPHMDEPSRPPLPGKKFPTSKVEALIRKHQSASPGTPVDFETTSKVSPADAEAGGAKDETPDVEA